MIRIVFLTLYFFSILNASDNLEEYRKNGIETLIKTWDTQLESQQYWKEKLSNLDTTFGYLENNKDIFFCDKNKSTLSHYK